MVDINSTYNYTLPFNLNDDPFVFVPLHISSLICVFASALYLFLIKKKLSGLNITIKSILYFMAGGSFISNFISFVSCILMLFLKFQSFTTCAVIQITRMIDNFNILTSLALISQVRYYIAVKTAQIKAYNKKTLQYIIIAVYILSLSLYFVFRLIAVLYGRVPIITRCSGNTDIDNTKYQLSPMINGTFALLILIINLIGDISMLLFIWKRKNQVSPVQLIPWKSVSESEDDDLAVPVHATALSVVTLIVLLTSLSIYTKLDNSLVLAPVLFITLSKLWANVVIPYVMLFKIIKTKKPKPVIPKGLQMHEEDGGDVNEMADSDKNEQQKFGETNLRSNSQDFSNEVILHPKVSKFDSDCTDKHMELKRVTHEIPVMA